MHLIHCVIPRTVSRSQLATLLVTSLHEASLAGTLAWALKCESTPQTLWGRGRNPQNRGSFAENTNVYLSFPCSVPAQLSSHINMGLPPRRHGVDTVVASKKLRTKKVHHASKLIQRALKKAKQFAVRKLGRRLATSDAAVAVKLQQQMDTVKAADLELLTAAVVARELPAGAPLLHACTRVVRCWIAPAANDLHHRRSLHQTVPASRVSPPAVHAWTRHWRSSW
jgi:hypothetical protein